MTRLEKIQLAFSYFLQATLVVAIFWAAFSGQWLNLFLTLCILYLTFLPAIIEKSMKVSLPIEFELVMIFFAYATLFLGELNAFYLKFWWWDVLFHGSSGLILGFIGFLIVYILNYEQKIHLGPKFVALFSFTFAMAIGGVWEIFEFALDSVFGLNFQKSGLVDTMWDLILDASGAIVASYLGYLYIKKGRAHVFERMLKKFMDENPKLFPPEQESA